jgi:hypothetical protein
VIHLGEWQTALDGVTCDALIFDAPYSARSGAANKRSDGYSGEGLGADYDALTEADVRAFCESWAPRTRGWMVSLTDWPLSFAWYREMESIGRYVFEPVTCVIRAMSVRVQADGPSSWTLYAVASRPRTREFADWGVLDGAYVGGCGGNGRAGGTERSGGRGKPQWLMQALVRDYSKAGDVVCDPYAGWGSTLIAAAALGRKAIGAECVADAHSEASRRLARPTQVDLFEGAA